MYVCILVRRDCAHVDLTRTACKCLTCSLYCFGNDAIRCAYNQQGSLAKSPTFTDGVLGLSSAAVSLPSQLAEQGLIKNIFAHCIAGDGGSGGYLFLGDKLLPARGITWAPFLKKPETCVAF